MRLKPSKPHPELDRLLAKARDHVMTPAEIYEQRISFVYGQCAIENPSTTKEMVREEARKLYGPPPVDTP